MVDIVLGWGMRMVRVCGEEEATGILSLYLLLPRSFTTTTSTIPVQDFSPKWTTCFYSCLLQFTLHTAARAIFLKT